MFIGTEGVLRRPLTYDNHSFMYSRQKDKKAKREKGEMTEREKESILKRQNKLCNKYLHQLHEKPLKNEQMI